MKKWKRLLAGMMLTLSMCTLAACGCGMDNNVDDNNGTGVNTESTLNNGNGTNNQLNNDVYNTENNT